MTAGERDERPGTEMSAEPSSVLEQVVGVARAQLDLADDSAFAQEPEALLSLRLVEDLGLDSIQLLTLAVEVENHFEVALDGFGDLDESSDPTDDDGSVEAITTLGDLVLLIETTIAAQVP